MAITTKNFLDKHEIRLIENISQVSKTDNLFNWTELKSFSNFALIGNGRDVSDSGSNPVYSGNSFNTGNENLAPSGLSFNADGTKMFVIDSFTNAIYEYTLSVGFDLSTGVYSGNSLIVLAQSTSSSGLSFNADGTKMFITDASNSVIYEYNLSVGFDLSSTVVYSGNSLSAAGDLISASGLSFNADGTKMFITDDTDIITYNLSVGFDLSSTVVYSGIFSATSQSDASGLSFNADGTKMFVIASNSNDIYEYTLSVGFDLSTGVYSGNSLIVLAQSTSSSGLSFNADGTKMFVIASNSNYIYEYTLSIPFDLSTTTLVSHNSQGTGIEWYVSKLPDGSNPALVKNQVFDGTVKSNILTEIGIGEINQGIADLNLTSEYKYLSFLFRDSVNSPSQDQSATSAQFVQLIAFDPKFSRDVANTGVV